MRLSTEQIKLVAELPFFSDDLGKAVTITEWLQTILLTLFEEGEGFSGKRPFGNSAWTKDPAKAMIKAGIIQGTIDSDGYIQDFNEDQLWACLNAVVKSLRVQ